LLYNSAGFYPQCVDDLTHDEKLDEREVVLSKSFDRCLELSRASRSPLVMPFAGDYALCGSLASLNPYLPVSTPHTAARFLEAHDRPAIALGAGGLVHLGDEPEVTPGEPYTLDEAIARAGSIDATYPYQTDPPVDPARLADLLEEAADKLRGRQERVNVHPDYRVHLVGLDEVLLGAVDLSAGSASHDVVCHLDERLLVGILERRFHWDNAEIGCHLRFARSNHPDYSSDMYFVMALLHT
jgi:UDP-MurNAc hydroxylase